jgi:ferredoxin
VSPQHTGTERTRTVGHDTSESSRQGRRADGAERAHQWRLRVDWPACRAEGLCHELLPELITLDELGYPLVTGPVTAGLRNDAKAAVRACPRLALRVVP